MKILGIDTSTMTTSLALLDEDRILGEYSVTGQTSHSERVMEMVGELFAKHDLSPKDIDLWVGGIGPGSFTGLRIGITMIKTMAQALEKEALGISTLRGLAQGYPGDSLIIPILDARRNRVYTGMYQWKEGKLQQVFHDTVLPWEALIEEIGGRKGGILGPGVESFKDEILKESNLTIAPPWYHQVRSIHLCYLAREDYQNGRRESLYQIAPNYVKKSQAEREWEKKHHGDLT